MPRFAIALSLAILCAAPAGCLDPGYDPGDDAEAADEIGRDRSPITLTRPEFRLGTGVTVDDELGWDERFWEPGLCDQWSDGVVRSWGLNEKNKYDFYWSRVFCREMNRYGTMGSDWDSREHFYYSDDGTFGRSAVPLDKLPVGLRLRNKEVLLDGIYKVSDLALLYDDAEDILNGHTGYQQASWAFGGRSGRTTTLTCRPGRVLVGISVAAEPNFYRTKSEIRGVRVHCKTLFRD